VIWKLIDWVSLCGSPPYESRILPSFQSPLGALPARFKRERLLIVGCGDVGLRVAGLLRERMRLLALTSSPLRSGELRLRGVTPLHGDLDDASTLYRLAGLATRVLYLAPPPSDGWSDPRIWRMTRVLRLRSRPLSLVYGSTSGVYGDCQGQRVDESRPPRPDTPRARRRAAAEAEVRLLGRSGSGQSGVRASILRIPGIYASDRPGGTPRERLLKRTPVLRRADDVYTNHIHADDLARTCLVALFKGRAQRVYNVSDDSAMLMGDYFDLAADLFGLKRPPRLARKTAAGELPLLLLSFMGESRRLDNHRLKHELGLRLRYPTVREGLLAGLPPKVPLLPRRRSRAAARRSPS
jgi:nucleoside-diphosphate-sugar epimerase